MLEKRTVEWEAALGRQQAQEIVSGRRASQVTLTCLLNNTKAIIGCSKPAVRPQLILEPPASALVPKQSPLIASLIEYFVQLKNIRCIIHYKFKIKTKARVLWILDSITC